MSSYNYFGNGSTAIVPVCMILALVFLGAGTVFNFAKPYRSYLRIVFGILSLITIWAFRIETRGGEASPGRAH